MHTILLVEDEAPLRELICDYLTAKSGGEWRVLPAADGTEWGFRWNLTSPTAWK